VEYPLLICLLGNLWNVKADPQAYGAIDFVLLPDTRVNPYFARVQKPSSAARGPATPARYEAVVGQALFAGPLGVARPPLKGVGLAGKCLTVVGGAFDLLCSGNQSGQEDGN
jgi:hypothetical protein